MADSERFSDMKVSCEYRISSPRPSRDDTGGRTEYTLGKFSLENSTETQRKYRDLASIVVIK